MLQSSLCTLGSVQRGRRSSSSSFKQLYGHCSMRSLQIVGTGDGTGVGSGEGNGLGSHPSMSLSKHSSGQQLQSPPGNGRMLQSSLCTLGSVQRGRRSSSSSSKQLYGHCSMRSLQIVGTGDGTGVGSGEGNGLGSHPSMSLSKHSFGQQLQSPPGNGRMLQSSLCTLGSVQRGGRSSSSSSKQLYGHCSMRSLQIVGTGDGTGVGTGEGSHSSISMPRHSSGQQLQSPPGNGSSLQSSLCTLESVQRGRRSSSSSSKQV
jgi:hypothetical protein